MHISPLAYTMTLNLMQNSPLHLVKHLGPNDLNHSKIMFLTDVILWALVICDYGRSPNLSK